MKIIKFHEIFKPVIFILFLAINTFVAINTGKSQKPKTYIFDF